MSEESLHALLPTLEEIEASDVTRPNIPVAIVHQEAHDLLALCEDDVVRAKLLSVGLDASYLDGLGQAIGASRHAQSRWVVARDQSKPDAQKAREAEGAELRRSALDACRWNLRRSRLALDAVSRISDGEGVADLVQDLSDLATLIRANLAAFEADTSFDASAVAEQALQLSAEIQAGLSESRDRRSQVQAIDLRDRAITHLSAHVNEVREAGRYAYRDDEAMARKFASAYNRRRSRKKTGPTGP